MYFLYKKKTVSAHVDRYYTGIILCWYRYPTYYRTLFYFIFITIMLEKKVERNTYTAITLLFRLRALCAIKSDIRFKSRLQLCVKNVGEKIGNN